MEWCLSEECSSKWSNLLITLSLPRGVELAEKLVQNGDVEDKNNIFHWPCFLKHLTSCTIVATKDHDILERTHYSSLPYSVRINLLILLLRQHVVVGHKELERFVINLKDEINTSGSHNWESNLLDRIQELVKPSPVNVELLATVHLSDKVIEGIANDWPSNTGTAGMAPVVSWSSKKEERSRKRSHSLLSTLSEPSRKKIKTRKNDDNDDDDDDDDDTTSQIISENEKSVVNEDIAYNLQNSSKSSDVQTEIDPPLDLSPIIAKLKNLCNNNASLNDEETTLLWEELASVQTDQLTSCLKLILSNELKEQCVINILHFIASMPVTLSNQIVKSFSTVIVLPHLLNMNQSASRTFLAAFSCVAKKQPNICIEAIISPLLQQKQFGSAHSDLVCTLIRGGDFSDHIPLLWRVLVATSSRDCWNDHIVLLAQALVDAQVELDQVLITETLQTLLHIAGYMTGNLRFGKLLVAIVSRYQLLMLDHLEDLEQLVSMVTPAFMQRSLQLAIKKLQC